MEVLGHNGVSIPGQALASLADLIFQIVDLVFTISKSYSICKTPIPLEILEDSCTLIDTNSKSSFGVLDRNGRKILDVLQKEVSVQLFADILGSSAISSRTTTQLRSSTKAQKLASTPVLCVTLYGRQSLFEPVGLFAARCKLYLQHPRNCDKNVQYRNPHCLSSKTSDILHTYNLGDALHPDRGHASELSINPIDLLADAAGQEILVDTDSPQALRTTLYKHQKQALTFMMQRERGWAIDGHRKDLWTAQEDSYGRMLYSNTISGQKQTRPPQEFRGGLLIDAPGLGKSLSIISLIASDYEGTAQNRCREASSSRTLLIVPKTRKTID